MVSFGTLFKPGTEFTVNTSDALSGTTSLTYSIYRIEKDNNETELVKDQSIAIRDEAGKVKISDHSGTYKICTSATDLVGKSGTKSCASVMIGYKGVDETTGDNDCPDINIDLNDDGIAELNIDVDGDSAGNEGHKIPELNIDSDYDGKADINVDSDDDQRADLNLVQLKEWNPGICTIVDGKTYATQEDIKPVINIVLDNGFQDIKDQIPALNIDNKGDYEPHLNISKDGKKAYLNIVKLHEWKPLHDFKYQGFLYDSIGTNEDDPIPELNIDTDDDGRPDVNVDSNDDGKEDLNIDMNGDLIPDIDIDGDGDGKPDINVDTNDDGEADKNVIKITEWKPNKDVDGDILYDTMEFENKSELEDNGIKVEKPDGTFLPNFAIKVNDVTDSIAQVEKDKIHAAAKDQEIKTVYEVHLLKDNVQVNPDGTLKVKIPVVDGIKNPKLLIQQKDGSYKTVEAVEEEGFYVYETDYLGNVSVIGDKEIKEEPKEDPKQPDVKLPSNNPGSSVQGNYTGGVGGAGTGDETNIMLYVFGLVFTTGCLFFLVRKRRKEESGK